MSLLIAGIAIGSVVTAVVGILIVGWYLSGMFRNF